MNVVYFAVGQDHAEMAEDAAEALRLSNPKADAWVITDDATQFRSLIPFRVPCSEATLIYDRLLGQWRFLREHGRALFLDSDCVVNGDLDGVFKGPIAVTERVPPRGLESQIYNGGVLYAEGGDAVRFWQDWADQFPYMDRKGWAWYGDQVTLPLVVEHHTARVTVYPWETHNYVPTKLSECERPIIGKHIVHFKGKRKSWLPVYLDVLRAHYNGRLESLLRSAQ